MASTGNLEVEEGDGKSVLASKPTPLQINQAKLLEELKYKLNFKSRASYGFKLTSMADRLMNGFSLELKLHYGCFNTSRGISGVIINSSYSMSEFRLSNYKLVLCNLT